MEAKKCCTCVFIQYNELQVRSRFDKLLSVLK